MRALGREQMGPLAGCSAQIQGTVQKAQGSTERAPEDYETSAQRDGKTQGHTDNPRHVGLVPPQNRGLAENALWCREGGGACIWDS